MTNFERKICLTLCQIEDTIVIILDNRSNKRRWVSWEIRIQKKPRRKRVAQHRQQAQQRRNNRVKFPLIRIEEGIFMCNI